MSDSSPASPLRRIDLARTEDPRDVVHDAVAAIASGDRVMLSTRGVRGVLASAVHPNALERPAPQAESADPLDGPTLFLRGSDELTDWVPALRPIDRRLTHRIWPGPVRLVFTDPGEGSLLDRLRPEARAILQGENGIAFQLPDDPFTRDVLRLCPAPAIFWPLSELGLDRGGIDCQFLVESPRGTDDPDAAVLQINDGGVTVLRSGPDGLGAEVVERLSATMILFVCTGNTCRSPMAEAICKVLLAEKIGCHPGELERHGYVVRSAGVAAMKGMPAAANAVETVRSRGGSLDSHRSCPVSLELVGAADHIVAMTGDHLDTLLERVPEAAPKAGLLHPEGLDVADPYGADRETYRRTAEEIETYLRTLLDSLDR